MTLTFIGLGLFDKTDITVKGLQAIQNADVVYLEYYTSIMHNSIEELEAYYKKKIHLAPRTLVEQQAEETILKDAQEKSVVFLVAGDVFCATTHSDLYLRAKEKNIQTQIINNASVFSAIANTGLMLYRFGKTPSLVFFDANWRPESAYDTIAQNLEQNLHTLVLLDIKVSEPTREQLQKEDYTPQPPRFMTVNQAITQLFELEEKKKQNILTPQTKIVAIARLGATDQQIVYDTCENILKKDFQKPLHSLVVPAKLHFTEEEMLESFSQ
ncbi:MAG: diphthine synthase [Candidatus Woesearchaeota archaeon]